MALSPRLEFRQAQTLTLTPQLMQSIRLLTLSHLELNEFVEAELLRNPLIEREDGSAPTDRELGEAPETEQRASETFEDTVDHGDRMQTADTIADGYDTAIENVFPDSPSQDGLTPSSRIDSHGSGSSSDSATSGGDTTDFTEYTAARPTLSDHLWDQVSFILLDPAERMIARHLIDNLNEAGYLATTLDEIGALLGAELAQVQAVLAKVQGCEPVGVFARDVPECLALQLTEKNRLDPMMARLLEHLPLLASHDMAALMRAVGADREDLADMIAEIRQLDPRPGLAFDSGPVETVIPDVFVKQGPGGTWLIELNPEVLPRVLVNRDYYATITKKARDPAEKLFLSESLQTANWLAKSLDQRAQTILKVTIEIVRQQEGFLLHGVSHLRPMTLRMVAEAIEMHESTVSRVTSNKYLATQRGLLEMKYFFTTAIHSSNGGSDHSAEAVRHSIRQMIDGEKPTAILSDDVIADMLKREQGIDLARRTVAKYREAMNIASSVIRRRQKKSLERAD